MQLEKVLNDAASPNDFESDQKLRLYYQTCHNEELREKVGMEPIKKLLKRLGGWPVLEGRNWANKYSFRWYHYVLEMSNWQKF